jgi:hypothetical protein
VISTVPTGLEADLSFDLLTKKLTIGPNVSSTKAGTTFDVKVEYFLEQINCNSGATCAYSQKESGGDLDIGSRHLPDDNSYVDGHACAAICNASSTCTAWSYHGMSNSHRHCDLSTSDICDTGVCDPVGTGGNRWAGNKVAAASTSASCTGTGRPSISQNISVKIPAPDVCENTWTLPLPQSETFFLNPATTSAFPSDPNATPVDDFISNTNAG